MLISETLRFDIRDFWALSGNQKSILLENFDKKYQKILHMT